MKTAQLEHWRSDFGRAYTDRNSLTPETLDALYRKNYGIGRSELNQRFLADIPRNARILEVGCNEGNQLCALREMGFQNLYGIEIQDYALRKARARLQSAQLALATAFEIPYPDGFFDLVFTSGVLIHIAPADLPRALREIHRCAGRFIWGLEYYSPQPTEVRISRPRETALENGLRRALPRSLRRPRSGTRRAVALSAGMPMLTRCFCSPASGTASQILRTG